MASNMMKATAKRRRSKAQVLEDKLKAQNREEEMLKKLAEIEQMQQAIAQMQAEREQLVAQTHQVKDMFENGVIKQDD